MTRRQARYSLTAKTLHWLIAILVICMIPLGWFMSGLSNEDPWYYRAFDLHLTLGVVVLTVFFIKIIWMLISPNPKLADSLARWEYWSARTVHGLLTGSLAVVPALGYLSTTTQGDPVVIYELLEIPSLVELSEEATELLIELHMVFAYGTAALVIIHVLAVARHLYIKRDGIFKRMSFRR